MEEKQQHIIRQLGIEVNLTDQKGLDNHALSERISDLGQQQIPQILDRVLTQHTSPDVFYRYDKIVLELDIEKLEHLDQVLSTQLLAQLEKKLVHNQPVKVTSYPSIESELSKKESIGPAEWILHFVEKGFLPWSTPKSISLERLKQELKKALALNPSFALTLRQICLNSRASLRRVIVHFGSNTLKEIYKVLSAHQFGEEDNLVLEKISQIKTASLEEQVTFWLEQFLKSLPAQQTNKSALEEEISNRRSISITETTPTPTPTEAIYIDHAGLILLHPFLPEFLRSQLVTTQEDIIDVSKAATLLYSLISGENPQTEWQLILPKVLLGIPLEEALDLIEVTPDELVAGEALIAAAIKHWSTLGNTSIDSFRQNFLQREGVLSLHGEDWYLKVQQAPYDLLLDRLPWNIAIIQTPWMHNFLNVEWS